MARNPYYSGSIASQVLPQSPTGGSGFGDALHTFAQGAGGGGKGGIFDALFYNRNNDPEVQLADQRRAVAEGEFYKNEQAKRGVDATTGFGDAMKEYEYRAGGPAGVQADASKLAPIILGAYQGALAQGADPKQASALVKAFAAQTGDANTIVTVNSALEAKYLNENESPTIARQDLVREDEQGHDMAKHEGELKMKKYGFDKSYDASIYNTNVDAGTQRRGQDISAGTTRRGQDMTDRRANSDTNKRLAADVATQTIETVTKDPGRERYDPNPFERMFLGKQPVAARAPSVTKRTTKRPIGAAPTTARDLSKYEGAAPPGTGQQGWSAKRLRYNPKTGNLE